MTAAFELGNRTANADHDRTSTIAIPPAINPGENMGYNAEIISTGPHGYGTIVNVDAAQAVATKHFSERGFGSDRLVDVIAEFAFDYSVNADGSITLESRFDSKVHYAIESFYEVLAAGFDPELRHTWSYCGEDGDLWTDSFHQGVWKFLSTETVAVDATEGTLIEKLTTIAELNENTFIGHLAKDAAAALVGQSTGGMTTAQTAGTPSKNAVVRHFNDQQLENIQLHYHCETCPLPETATVAPTFFEQAGSPVCDGCGDDMAITGADVDMTLQS